MSLQEFKNTLKKSLPPSLNLAGSALWYDGTGNWEQAHNLVADVETKDAAAIHAYLHRKEGDEGNASYWYARAGRSFYRGSLESEWEDLVKEFIVNN